MNIFEIIAKSQNKIRLNQDEIKWMIQSYAKGDLPDYQISSWLATVFLNELSLEETDFLTGAIIETGATMKWDFKAVDKHSTGGVGDKTSLIIGPLVASLGYKVPMISGRGLGHTGGTLDKLESIPGFQTQIPIKDFHTEVAEKNICFIGQTSEICPADKKLYALRDATHTVANIPLICASIMSKKISEGLSGLVLDVKFGTGAFMTDLQKSKKLAERLLHIADRNRINGYAAITSMQQPLGRYVGNRLEVLECLQIMKEPMKYKDEFYDNYELSLLLSALMIVSIDEKHTFESALKLCQQKLDSGEVYSFFENIVLNQEGSLQSMKIEAKEFIFNATTSGYMNYNEVKNIGMAAVFLGAGRKTIDEKIDPSVGFYCYKKTGDSVKEGEPLFKVYYNEQSRLDECLKHLKTGFEILTSAPPAEHVVNSILKIENQKLIEVNYERHR